MLIIRNKSKKWLFNNLKLFNGFTFMQKRTILFIAYNNLMIPIDKRNSYLDIVNDITDVTLDDVQIINRLTSLLEDGLKDIFINSNDLNSWEEFTILYQQVTESLDCSDISRAVLLNLILYKSGLCPLIVYSFYKWQWGKEYPNRLERLVEFSLTYLYRMVPSFPNYCPDNYIKVDCCGSTCNLYFNQSNNTICKSPKNLAAYLYLLPQEYSNAIVLKHSSLKCFLAQEYKYDYNERKLYHKMVQGKTGEYYLFNHIRLSNIQIQSLRNFYNAYINRKHKDIILDVHPGNFVWDKIKKQWYIVDIGSIPDIGKEYYVYRDFETYLENIWINREQNMKKYPIRSINLKCDLLME